MIRRRVASIALAVVLSGALVGAVGAFRAGSVLMAPAPSEVGALPPDLHGESVRIPSASGSLLAGWFLPGRQGAGAVVLMHGNRGSRASMLGRARFLNRAGHAVLLFDFQASGESPGSSLTFGYLESRDARAAVAYVRDRLPGERVGVVGVSLGGVAALVADPPLEADALVLEAAYPSIDEAVANRLSMSYGAWATMLGPALTLQLRPRLGFWSDALRPVDRVALVTAPKLFVAGTEDRHTTMAESMALYEAACGPKELWAIEGAAHVDLHAFARADYERRVGAFLAAHLTSEIFTHPQS
jgi:pimeloyl-ACP methyl ester carboxylesterase